MRPRPSVLLVPVLLVSMLLLTTLPACRTLGSSGSEWVAVETSTGRVVTLDEMADELAGRDVVFLGEEHDNDTGHRLQIELTERLLARRPRLAVSMEMFELDVQPVVDDYLDGRRPEASFLADSRPWPNYPEHYRPAIELARRERLAVLAANVPRPLAARVSKEGLGSVQGEAFIPRTVHNAPGDYRDRFAGAMGGHGSGFSPEAMERFYTAQCLKDDAMAESIADLLGLSPDTQVVHWCGKFHSDFGLGTVERLRLRRPGVSVGIVTMRSGSRDPALIDDELRRSADYVWMVP